MIAPCGVVSPAEAWGATARSSWRIAGCRFDRARGWAARPPGLFLRWLEGRTVVPTIHALSGHVDEMREIELERARRMLANGTPPDRVLDALARGLANKFLHAPLSALNTAGDAERAELIALFQRVYRLHEPPVDGH